MNRQLKRLESLLADERAIRTQQEAAEYDGDWELADDLDDDLTELGGEIWATELELKRDNEPQYA